MGNTRNDGPSPKSPLFPPLESLPAIRVEAMNIGPQWTPSTTTKSLAVFATLTPDVPSSKVESQLATLNPGLKNSWDWLISGRDWLKIPVKNKINKVPKKQKT